MKKLIPILLSLVLLIGCATNRPTSSEGLQLQRDLDAVRSELKEAQVRVEQLESDNVRAKEIVDRSTTSMSELDTILRSPDNDPKVLLERQRRIGVLVRELIMSYEELKRELGE